MKIPALAIGLLLLCGCSQPGCVHWHLEIIDTQTGYTLHQITCRHVGAFIYGEPCEETMAEKHVPTRIFYTDVCDQYATDQFTQELQ